MAKHSQPGDNSFTLSLLRHLGAAVVLVAIVAAAFWGVGQLRSDEPGVTVASGTGEGDPASSPDGDATADPATDPPTGPATSGPAGPETSAPEAEASDDPAAEPTDDPTAVTTPTPSDTATASVDRDASDGFDPAEISVQVLDAAGDDGSATARVAGQLRDDGFRVVATNKAVRVYEQTTVFYTPGNEAKAQQVADTYGYAVVEPQPGNLSNSVDVHLVVGADA